MIILLIATAAAIVTAHLFVMKSVDGYSSYGQREWEMFQAERLKH